MPVPKVRFVITGSYEVTPGTGGYVDQTTPQECLAVDRKMYEDEQYGVGDLVQWGDDVEVTFSLVDQELEALRGVYSAVEDLVTNRLNAAVGVHDPQREQAAWDALGQAMLVMRELS